MIVFTCLGMAGFVLFLFSTMFGGHDHTDLGHDVGGHDAAHDSGPSFFSVFAFSFFLMGFGGTGALLQSLNWTLISATPAALLAGCLLWAGAFGFMDMLHKQQADSTVTPARLLGTVGVVTVPAVKGSVAKIQCAACSEELIVRAQEELTAGERVRIVEDAGGVYLVKKC